LVERISSEDLHYEYSTGSCYIPPSQTQISFLAHYYRTPVALFYP